MRCPGQEMMSRDPKKIIYHYGCSCGNEVEFFYDDKKRPCEACQKSVQPDLATLMKYHSCSSTCKSARDCLGDEKYKQLVMGEWRIKHSLGEEIGRLLSLAEKDEDKDTLKSILNSNIQRGFLIDIENDLGPLKERLPESYERIDAIIDAYVFGGKDEKRYH